MAAPRDSAGAPMMPMTVEKLNDVSSLVKECATFVESAKNNLAIPFAAFERVRQWRVRRRESEAIRVIDTLLPRIKEVELGLRFTITDTCERKAALREQAKFLLARLSSCITYNQSQLDCLFPVVEDTRSVVIALSDSLATVKRMISFNNELLRLKNVQNAGTKRGGGYNYNRQISSNIALFRPVSEDDLNRDSEYVPLLARLNSLREIREKYVALLAQLLESREMYTANFDNCNHCFKQICDLLRLDKKPFTVASPTSPKDQAKQPASPDSAPPSPTATPTKRLSLVLQSVVGGVVGTSPRNSSVEAADEDEEEEAAKFVATQQDSDGNTNLLIGDEVIPVYSHQETCSDCTCVVTITNNCIESFEEIHTVQVLATKQLSTLVEVRERINEVIESVTPAGGTPVRDDNGNAVDTPDVSDSGSAIKSTQDSAAVSTASSVLADLDAESEATTEPVDE